MMTIIWKDKPKQYDTRQVQHLWFEKQSIKYTIAGERGGNVLSAPIKSIAHIIDDSQYAAFRPADPA